MNQDSREESVLGGALKLVGGATATAGAAYGIHRGMNSEMATNHLTKQVGKEGGPGMVAKGITKYREKVNPMVDKTKGAIKGMFETKPNLGTSGPGGVENSQVDALKKSLYQDGPGGIKVPPSTPAKANTVGPTMANAEKLKNGPTVANAEMRNGAMSKNIKPTGPVGGPTMANAKKAAKGPTRANAGMANIMGDTAKPIADIGENMAMTMRNAGKNGADDTLKFLTKLL